MMLRRVYALLYLNEEFLTEDKVSVSTFDR
jgi:hypothetical protein